eukprot:9475539-Pyramimonas_sp.AAC.1
MCRQAATCRQAFGTRKSSTRHEEVKQTLKFNLRSRLKCELELSNITLKDNHLQLNIVLISCLGEYAPQADAVPISQPREGIPFRRRVTPTNATPLLVADRVMPMTRLWRLMEKGGFGYGRSVMEKGGSLVTKGGFLARLIGPQ